MNPDRHAHILFAGAALLGQLLRFTPEEWREVAEHNELTGERKSMMQLLARLAEDIAKEPYVQSRTVQDAVDAGRRAERVAEDRARFRDDIGDDR